MLQKKEGGKIAVRRYYIIDVSLFTLTAVTVFNAFFYTDLLLDLIACCTPVYEPEWLRYVSVLWGFTSELLLLVVPILWWVYTYFFICEPIQTSSCWMNSRWKIAVMWGSRLLLITLSAYLIIKTYNVMMSATFMFGVVEQHSVIHRLSMVIFNREFCLPILCLVGWPVADGIWGPGWKKRAADR
ncbi:MAG: hypothetical protein CSA32_04305 [Desulfobulbus propionicus]|nr:MAG: hypothetical protein CSA32_04305 [Desulfobulbus propionicus]